MISSGTTSWIFEDERVGRTQAGTREGSVPEEQEAQETSVVGSRAAFKKMQENLNSRKERAHLGAGGVKGVSTPQARHLQSVGVLLKAREETNQICISEVISGSNAASGGLLVGDIVARVDGVPANVEDLEEVIGRMTGDPSSAVKLTLLRNVDQHTHVLQQSVLRDVPVEAMDFFASPGPGEERGVNEPRYIIKTAHGSMQVAVDAVDDSAGTVFLSPVRSIPVFEYPDHSSR